MVFAFVKIVAIDKGDGGKRPLGISSKLWHSGATAVIEVIAEWAGTWAPHELAGGFKERGALHIHGRFRTAWSAAKRLGFCARLQDLAKAFDRISIHQATAMLRCLGAPRAICRLLVRCYARCRRVFTCNKVTSQHWVMVMHGLL